MPAQPSTKQTQDSAQAEADGESRVDCALIGAGPAGISAAHWLRALKVDFRWFDAAGRPGGMLRRVSNPINNYPGGFYEDGRALIDQLRRGMKACGVPGPQKGRVAEISAAPKGAKFSWTLTFDGGAILRARALIMATGTTYRRLQVPGEAAGLGDYISQSASADAAKFRGRPVLVVGGGDAAFEGALILAKESPRVTILMRSAAPRARKYFRERVENTANISVYPTPCQIIRVEPAPAGCRVHLRADDELVKLEAGGLFVRVGVEPALPQLISPHPLKLVGGFIQVDSAQRANLPGLFAAGDITHRALRAVAAAAGAGAAAAHSAAKWLDARA